MKRGHWQSTACALLLLGCATRPDLVVPEGTYVEKDGVAVLVFDDDRVELHVPTARHADANAPYGHDYSYRMANDGQLAFIGASTQYYYLWDIDCEWYWTGRSVECRRESGDNLTFVRDTSPAVRAPATEEQRVWLAVAQHLRDARSADVVEADTLVLYARTAFVSRFGAVSQLRERARVEFCGNSYDEARGILSGLKHMSNFHDKSLRDTFAHRPGIELVERQPAQGGALGLSVVLFKGEREAYVSVDLGGKRGAILRVARPGTEWYEIVECGRWGSG